jgi:hypothetical protein
VGKSPASRGPLKVPRPDKAVLLWSSPEKYYASKLLHDASWAAIMARYAKAAASLQLKLTNGNEELDLTPDERMVLDGAKRRSKSSEAGGGGGPRRPVDVLKAMLGFVVPMLGRYATNIAMEWLNSEIKYIATTVTGTITNVSGYSLLNGIAQGTDFNQRVGNSIRILGLDWFLQVYNQHADANQQYRFWIIVDTQSDAAAPTDATFAEGGTLNVNGLVPYIKAAPDRYAILHDECFNIDAAVNAIHHSRRHLDNLVAQDLHTLYELTTGVIAAISRGAIYFVHVSTDAANALTVTANFRVFYTDN